MISVYIDITILDIPLMTAKLLQFSNAIYSVG